jgi:trimethylamine--corrinoid protein Co-methyltransferase
MASETAASGRRRRHQARSSIRRDVDVQHLLHTAISGARVLSDDEVEHIHERAFRYLERSGVRVLLAEARQRFAAAGAMVDHDTQMVRLDVDQLRELVALAPAEVELCARVPARSAVIGGDHVVFAPVAGPPYVSDRIRGRRPGTLADYSDFLRLTQRTDVLHLTTPAVEPQDVGLHERHLQMMRAQLLLTDRVPFVYARGRAQLADSYEMIRLANGIGPDEFRSRPYSWVNINTNSPRQLDIPMSLGIIDSAAAGQLTIMTPFTLAGAMAPVSVAGALVLQHIEAIAAIALAQVVRPGAPVAYGAFTSNVDMRSGAPAFGTAESVTAAIASGQLARHLGVPWRSQATSSSNTEDAQGAAESLLSLTGALLGGANIVIHAAGWQEGGLTASFEKFVLDVEVLETLVAAMQRPSLDDLDQAIEALDEVGPGGHFFGASHTMERYATAFREPFVFSRQNLGQWTEDGSHDAATRATGVWQQWLREAEQPHLDDDRRAAIDAFVARRSAEGGAPPES